MNKTKHLDRAICILRGTPASKTVMNMRPMYEQALQAQGWESWDKGPLGSEWCKDHKRMNVQNGDRVFISFDGVRWTPLNAHAKRNILLHSQD